MVAPDPPIFQSLDNVLNAMEMDGRVKRKVVVNNKLGTVSSIRVWLERRTYLYIVSIVHIQLWPWELPIAQNDISVLPIRCSNLPSEIDLEENVSAKRKRRIGQKAYSRKRFE